MLVEHAQRRRQALDVPTAQMSRPEFIRTRWADGVFVGNAWRQANSGLGDGVVAYGYLNRVPTGAPIRRCRRRAAGGRADGDLLAEIKGTAWQGNERAAVNLPQPRKWPEDLTRHSLERGRLQVKSNSFIRYSMWPACTLRRSYELL